MTTWKMIIRHRTNIISIKEQIANTTNTIIINIINTTVKREINLVHQTRVCINQLTFLNKIKIRTETKIFHKTLPPLPFL